MRRRCPGRQRGRASGDAQPFALRGEQPRRNEATPRSLRSAREPSLQANRDRNHQHAEQDRIPRLLFGALVTHDSALAEPVVCRTLNLSQMQGSSDLRHTRLLDKSLLKQWAYCNSPNESEFVLVCSICLSKTSGVLLPCVF